MFSKGLLVYLKIAVLVVLVGTLYWQDFLLLGQKAIYSGWVTFSFVILFLVSVFVFLRRSALKSLLLLSETHAGKGLGLVLVALSLYAVGSHTSYTLLLHLCSLIIFMVAYFAFIIDSRISKMMFLPFLTLLFLVPPVEVGVFDVQNLPALVTLYLSVDTVIVILLFLTVKELLPQNRMERAHCPICQSNMLENDIFCPHCGRQRHTPIPAPLKLVLFKFSALLSIVFLFAVLPNLAVLTGRDLAGRLALHFYTLDEIYVRFKDLFLTVVGIAVVLVFAGWVKTMDEKAEKATGNAFGFMNDEAVLLVAISALKRTRFFGMELVDSYEQLTESKVNLGAFYEQLTDFSKSGLIARDQVVKNGRLVMVWKKMFP